MRRDHRPLWLNRMSRGLERFRTRQFMLPQCDEAGPGCRFQNSRHIHLSGSGLILGQHVHLLALPEAPIHLSTWQLGDLNPSITVGDYSVINPGVRMTAAIGIEIGEGALIATGAYITDADWHGKYHRVYPPGSVAKVVLGSNVWVGDGAMILKGVQIGQNSIVGAGAVVTSDVADNTVVAGNPAKVVSQLDPGRPSTSRTQLFEELDYVSFEQRYLAELLGPNNSVDWLRSLLAPNRDRRD